MARFHVAALLALGAVSVGAQSAPPPAASAAIQPSPDSAEERKVLRTLSACLAEARPRWARQTLSHPYLSDAQASAAAQALRGKDSCIRGPEAEVTLRTSGMVGSLAEHYLQDEIDRADTARLANALSTISPLNSSEDFALCIAARNPAAARALALSEPGSAAETQAIGRLAPHVGPCTEPGEDLTVDLQSLRALVSTALYRGVTAVLAAK